MIQVVWLSASEYVEASGGTIWTCSRDDGGSFKRLLPSTGISPCHPQEVQVPR